MYCKLETSLAELSSILIENCKAKAYDGTILYTPDGISSYNALWLRDFSYMVEYAGSAIPQTDIAACIRYAIRHRREDGWMPDRVTGDGIGIYAAGEMGSPVGEANLDNTPFLIYTVYSLYQRMEQNAFASLFREWEPALTQGMSLIPLHESGLVYNDPQKPHSPYGFTDTVCKTGTLYMESLLFWRACRMMEELCTTFGQGSAEQYAALATSIEDAIASFREASDGSYYAASIDCHQKDIWGMAYMLYIGFPVPASDRDSLLDFLCANYERYMYKGQVRHLLTGEYWQKLLIEVEPETYQNGAYWATATGWLVWCLAQRDVSLAARTAIEAVSYLKEEGSYECVNENYQKLPSMVVSATNLYAGLKRAAAEFPALRSALDS